MTAKKQPAPKCGACGSAGPLTVVWTPGGGNETVACRDCADKLFIPAGFEE